MTESLSLSCDSGNSSSSEGGAYWRIRGAAAGADVHSLDETKSRHFVTPEGKGTKRGTQVSTPSICDPARQATRRSLSDRAVILDKSQGVART